MRITNRRRTARRGFTLIELLIVIAIIAILAAILFPVFARARENARKASCLSNLKQLGLGIMQYSQDYDEYNPPAAGYAGQSNWWDASWVTITQPYVKSVQIFRCPSDTADKTKGGWVRDGISYQINAYVNDFWNGRYGATTPGGDWIYNDWARPVSLAKINQPATTILVGERHNGEMQSLGTGASGDGNGYVGSAPFTGVNWMDSWFGVGEIPDGTRTGTGYPLRGNGTSTAAHNEIANYLFCDGHAKAMRPAATNPNPGSRPNDNMWDASRTG
jgi:prepilin-type N-terminal cleavage/methylation domain-containing protein/prepilin-type processing-associated H-X9-DG protein